MARHLLDNTKSDLLRKILSGDAHVNISMWGEEIYLHIKLEHNRLRGSTFKYWWDVYGQSNFNPIGKVTRELHDLVVVPIGSMYNADAKKELVYLSQILYSNELKLSSLIGVYHIGRCLACAVSLGDNVHQIAEGMHSRCNDLSQHNPALNDMLKSETGSRQLKFIHR